MGVEVAIIISVCAIAHVYLMARVMVILREIKDERVLIAQINDGQKWV
jgi:hypothetical protein